MQKRPDGWFVKMQFDDRFKGDIEEVKSILKIVTKHTEIVGKTVMIRFCKKLINIEGVFEDDEYGEYIHEIFLSRILNKPKSYG